MTSIVSRVRESALPRLVDQAAGTPVLALWGALRRQRPLPVAARRFGLMMFETIGDTLLAGTLVASLRAAIPDVELIVFASRGNRGVLELFDGINAVVEVPLIHPVAALAAVRSVPVDVMIDIGQWPRWYAVLCAMSRSRHTIGFSTPGQWRHYAYDTAIQHRDDIHELENFQRLLAPFADIRPAAPSGALASTAEPPAPVAAKAPYVLIHPWASGFNFAAREWPARHWVELVRRMGQFGRKVLVTGGPADRARSAALVAACGGQSIESIAGEWSLKELAAIVQHADAVVSVNTGIMHLAAILDVPLVALHGPTSRLRWGPIGTRSVALAPPAGTNAEFLNLGFEYPTGPVDCMDAISVDEVFSVLRAHLRT